MLTPRRFADPDYMASIAPSLNGGRLRTSPELAAEFHHALKPGGMCSYYWQLLGIMGWTSIHRLSQIRQPTLLLSGADDPIVPSVNAQIMSWPIPNARLHIFDDGHLGLLISVDELAPIVHDFLTTRDSS
jgi:pimeloyl-ACP methyl ester carboxylesterase